MHPANRSTRISRAEHLRRRHRDQRPGRVEVAGKATAAAAAIGEPLYRAGRAEVDGEVQLGIEVVGADQRHRLHRSPSSTWAT